MCLLYGKKVLILIIKVPFQMERDLKSFVKLQGLIYAGTRIIVGENLFVRPTFVDGVPVGSGLTHADTVAVSIGGKNKIASVAGKGKGMAFERVI